MRLTGFRRKWQRWARECQHRTTSLIYASDPRKQQAAASTLYQDKAVISCVEVEHAASKLHKKLQGQHDRLLQEMKVGGAC